MTDADLEVERIAALAWSTFSELAWSWPGDATLPDRWRDVARAVIADRAAQPLVTGGPTLMEVARERDAALDRVDQSLVLMTVLTGERDEARDLYTRAEQQRCDALAIAEANLRRAEAAEAERDALHARLAEVERDRWGEHDAAERHFRQRDEAIRERDEARAERDRLREAVACDPDEHAAYLAQRDEARTECEAAETQADAERARRKQAEATLNALHGLLTDAETERDMYRARNADLEASNDAVLTGLRHERDALQRRLAELEALRDEVERLRRGITAVSDLIDNSRGVTGLHLNGDEARWDDLRTGGRFEEWLRDFDAAKEQP